MTLSEIQSSLNFDAGLRKAQRDHRRGLFELLQGQRHARRWIGMLPAI